jgi:signal transduction histidine kinase/DNA-binding response OmpR family regulator
MPPIRAHLDCSERSVTAAVREQLEAAGAALERSADAAQLRVVSPERLAAATRALAARPRPTWPVLVVVDADHRPAAFEASLEGGADDYVALDDGEARLRDRLRVAVRRARRSEPLRARQALLAGVTDVLSCLLRASSVEAAVDEAIARLGEAADVDRVYVARHDEGPDDRPVIQVTHAWQAPGVPALPDEGVFEARPIARPSRPFFERLGRGETVSIRIDDLPEAVRRRFEGTGTRALLVVPLMHAARCVGQIGFADCTASRPWKPETRRILETTAEVMGEIFVRESATGELRRQARRLRVLFEATDPTLDVEDQLDAVLRAAAPAFDMELAVLMRIDRSGPDARGRVLAVAPDDERLTPGVTVPIEPAHEPLIERARPAVVKVIPKSAIGRRVYGFHSSLIVPLRVRGAPWGTLSLFGRAPRQERASPAERQALELLGRFVAQLLERRAADAERRALEERMRDAQRLESLGVLAGGVAHDFNNLLMAVLGNAELALLDLPEDAPAREPLGQITLAARRAAELTQQMLAYAGRARIDAEPVCLPTLVREMSGLLDAVLAKNVELRLETRGRPPTVRADAAQVRQVVLNLLTNAADALQGRPGIVSVRVEARDLSEPPRGRFVADGAGPGRYVLLEVADEGVGMSEAQLARIFEPFYTTKDEGRGLGLAVVVGIVRAHGGALRVRSTPGAGTTFGILWPAADGAPARRSDPPAEEVEGRLRGRRVLVVDDTPMVRSTVRKLLEHDGARVEVAEDGEAALARFDADPPFDAVVLDVTMPGMDGLAVLEALRARAPELPVVMMSGYAEALAERSPSSDPRFLFVQKPFRPERLLEALGALLDGPASPV